MTNNDNQPSIRQNTRSIASPVVIASNTLSSGNFNQSFTNSGPISPINDSFKSKSFKSASVNSLNVSISKENNNHSQSPSGRNQQQSYNSFNGSNLLQLSPERHLEYIEHLENEFDKLMRRKQQLDAQLTRLPYKATNTNMHVIRTSLENEVSSVDKQLASVKLELRKLNIIKTTH